MSYNFINGKQLLEICRKEEKKIWEILILRELEETDTTYEAIMERMDKTISVMDRSIEKGLQGDQRSLSGLIGGESHLLEEYRKKGDTLLGDGVLKAAAASMAVLEVNASMGKIVAAPTAGSSGIIPGGILTLGKERGKTKEEIIRSVLTATAIGLLIARNATVSGAEGGCQAEVGTASAMAAGGIVELMGGSPEQVLTAAALTIKNLEGLVCDPIAGRVECPCMKRNAIGTVNAMLCADMALAGIQSIVPFDDAVDAMYRVGRSLPYTLKETSLGGLAVTKTGLAITMELKEKNEKKKKRNS